MTSAKTTSYHGNLERLSLLARRCPDNLADVKFTVDKILDPTIPAVNKEGWFSRLDNVEIVDDPTSSSYGRSHMGPSLHALTQLAPIPEHIYGKGNFREHPANRHRWAAALSNSKNGERAKSSASYETKTTMDLRPISIASFSRSSRTGSVALGALKTGELDEMRVNQPQWETKPMAATSRKKFDKNHYYVPLYNYIAWNCRSIWFRDKRVRLAMTMLFDRETINEEIYSGHAKIVTGPFYINSWAYDSSIEPVPYNPDGARRILDEAGWTDSDSDGIRDKDGIKFEFDFSLSAEAGRRDGSRNSFRKHARKWES